MIKIIKHTLYVWSSAVETLFFIDDIDTSNISTALEETMK